MADTPQGGDEWPWDREPTNREVLHAIRAVQKTVNELKELAMSEQAQLAADVTAIEAVASSLVAATTAIEAEIATLEAEVAAGNPPDLTALNSAVAALTPIAAAVAAIAPAAAVQAFDPASGLPLYAYTGPAPVPGDPWVEVTDVTGAAGLILYTNTGDTPSNPPQFVEVGVWPAYTGALTPA